MWAGVSRGAAAAGGGAAALTSASIPVLVVSDVAGWAVAESIQWLVNQVQNIAEYPKHCQELLVLLRDPRLRKAVHALDQLTDLPEFDEYRPDYDRVCDALEEAEVVLLQGLGERHSESFLSVVERKLKHQVMDSDRPKSVIETLQPYCELAMCEKLFNTLKNTIPPEPTRVQRAASLKPLNPACGPVCILESREADLPQTIFKHGDDLVPEIDKLLTGTTARNIGIVGMGGIGKTTIARAVFERAKSRFRHAVWLTVGADADLKQLLRIAFTKLDPDHAPLETASDNLSYLAQKLFDENRSVLLVLDDVWLSTSGTNRAVLAALNFATRSIPGMQVAGSRLIVTTRDQRTLSYDPGSEADMDELKIFKPPDLDEASAQQLFYHHAFGAADATPPQFVDPDTCLQLIRRCRGNPLALRVRGSEMRHCTTAAEWDRRLASQQEKQESGEDDAMKICSSSVNALPPSLKECFMDFAAFSEDAEVEEAHLLHLFATHAPLYSAASLRAAAAKLEQLLSRSLVSLRVDHDQVAKMRGNVYCMHDILRSVAVQLSRKPESTRSFCGSRSRQSDCVRYFSLHSGTVEQADDERGPKISKHMRACIIDNVPLTWHGRLSCLPRMQYLSLQDPICEEHDLQTHMPSQMPMLRFLSLQCLASWLPESLMTGQLVHLDLSWCVSLKELPDGISGCSQLTHLDLFWCAGLKELPEGISGCSQLAHLDLSWCKDLKELPEGISGCSQLAHLDLSECDSLTKLPEGISGWRQVTRLHLSGCESLTELPDGISGCSQLAHLDLSGCEGLKELPDGISGCSQLAHLDLSGCEGLTELPEGISGCSQLAHLDLSWCDGLKELPDGISGCSQLAHLDLSECNSLTKLPEGVSGWSQLTHLDLSGCESLTELPEGIGCRSQLAHLDLWGCQGLTEVPEDISWLQPLSSSNSSFSSISSASRLVHQIAAGVDFL